jgi:hypothetical protein
MNEIKRKIRIIVDEGMVQCPICRCPVSAGWGHSCSQRDEWINSADFRLSAGVLAETGDGK